MSPEIICVDFNNTDSDGRVRLNTRGAADSIRIHQIELIEGKQVQLDDEDELRTVGILKFSKQENIWVAEINWNSFGTT